MFKLEFELWIESYTSIGSGRANQMSVIRVTNTRNDWRNYGDRMPFVLIYNQGQLNLFHCVGSNNNRPYSHRSGNLQVQRWYKLKFEQVYDNYQIWFRIYLDDSKIKEFTHDILPQEYTGVEIYASDHLSKYNPVNGKIRAFTFESSK